MWGNRREVRLAAAYALGLFALNVYIVRELFTIEFTRYLFNVDGLFISISRFLLDHPSERSWWPLWNLGMPFHCTYLPVLPMLVAVWAKITGYSPALSYHGVTAFFYCLGPVTLFLMAFGLSRRIHASFFSALAYAVV